VFVLSRHPAHERVVERPERVRHRRFAKCAVVSNPSPKDRVEHPRQIFEALVRAQTDAPPSFDFGAHVVHGPRAHRRREAFEIFPLSISCSPRTECVAEKIEALAGCGLTASIRISAVNDLRLLRMNFESASLEPVLNRFFDFQGLALRAAVNHDIVHQIGAAPWLLPLSVDPCPKLNNAAPSLHGFSAASSLLRAAPSLCRASVLWLCEGLPR
jgi:hypothetical protein